MRGKFWRRGAWGEGEVLLVLVLVIVIVIVFDRSRAGDFDHEHDYDHEHEEEAEGPTSTQRCARPTLAGAGGKALRGREKWLSVRGENMLRHRTPKEIAQVALGVSTLLVSVAFILGSKNGFSMVVLSLGWMAEGLLTGEIFGHTILGGAIRFVASIPEWFVPVFMILLRTNPRPKRAPAEKTAGGRAAERGEFRP